MNQTFFQVTLINSLLRIDQDGALRVPHIFSALRA